MIQDLQKLVEERSSPELTESFPVTIEPMDEANRNLLRNVRPAGWTNPPADGPYNLVVIGAGTAGLVAAFGAAGLGAKVALIEKDLVGGDCLNWGCVPSKSIIRPARVVADLARGSEMGVHLDGDLRVDFARVMQRMREIRTDISDDDSVGRIRREGVELFLGGARFTGPDRVEVDGEDGVRTLVFRKALIATGSRASTIPIEGLAEAGFLTNETLFQLTEQPQRLAVIGGGPIGAEMAQAFQRLGSQVTILEIDDQILVREDQDAAKIVQKTMVDEGVQLLLGVKIQRVEAGTNGRTIYFEREDGEEEIEVDQILLSVGRSPNVEGLNLETAGVEFHKKGVTTNDHLQTTNPDIYASGDVAQKYQFTHMADATSRLVIQNALFPGPKKSLSDLTVPWCTYTDPEIAHVGMYASDAEEKGIEIDTYMQPLAGVDRSRTDGHTKGFVKIHTRKGSDKIVGATIVASEAGEMINQITLAMISDAGLKTFSDMIFPYPVQSEAIKKIAGAYSRKRLTPFLKRITQTWFRWRR